MKAQKKTLRFLIFSLIILIFIIVGVMSVFSLLIGNSNNTAINSLGSVYMSGISQEISMHFETMINSRLTHVETILNGIDVYDIYEEKTLSRLKYEARVRGFEYLGMIDSDGNFETIYGEDIILADPFPFIESLQGDEKKAAISNKVSDHDSDSSNDIIALGVPAQLRMKSGQKSIALVGGIEVSTVSAALSLDDENSYVLTYSHIIRRDGSFIIRGSRVTESNYFDRVRASYSKIQGGSVENYIKELCEAMESNENYSASFFIGDEGHAMYCTHLSNSEWYLISILPYSTINEILFNSDHLHSNLYILSIAIVLLTIVLIFIKYFRITQKQMHDMITAREEAMRASKAKSEFLSNMSHDIRTPMNAIVGMTAIAVTNIDNKQQVQACLKKISLSSKHLLGLINDILDMSKIESGKMTLNMELVSLSEIMENIVTIAQPQVKTKSQHFDVFIHDIITENVYCDSVRLNQIILNLISNSIKFTPDGGTIQAFMYQEKSEVGENYVRVHIRVKDTGIGMSEEFKKRVFESFVREDSRRVNKTEGSGLGMAITKYIVDAMKGSIEVDSEPGKGTEFHIILDMEKATETEDEMNLPSWRMLVVDDDEMLCHSAVKSLCEIGIDASCTLNGEAALDMIDEGIKANKPYEIILIDWKLPGIDGLETTRRIRQKLNNNNIPIVLISAYDWSEIEADAKEAGVTGFISKPLFKSTLYHGLRQYSDGKEEAIVESGTEKNKFDNINVLLAEDNDLNWEIAYELLTPLGMNIEHAENGQICVEKFENSQEGYYDAILMDIRMPIMSGIEATEAIRKLDRSDANVPIIAMTADAFSEDKKKCLDAGMDGHVAKPIDIKEIEHLLEKFIKKV